MNNTKYNNYDNILKDLKDIEVIQNNIHGLLNNQKTELDNISDNISNIHDITQDGYQNIKDCNNIKIKKHNMILLATVGFICFGPVGGIITGLNTSLTTGIIFGTLGGYVANNIN